MNRHDGKEWSDRFLTEIKGILGMRLICEPAIEEDQTRNTDLVVLNMTPYRVACRVRRFEMLAHYASQFTIRWSCANGSATEIDKIRDGWGDFMFYGFADPHAHRLAQWVILKLDVFRAHEAIVMPIIKPNKDGRNSLAAYDLHAFPRGLIHAWGGTQYTRDLFADVCGSPNLEAA